MEKTIVANIQNLVPSSVYKLMNIISLPFHLKFFTIIIMILYYKNLISASQIFILISSQMILVAIKYIVKRHRPFRDDKSIKNEDVMDLDYFSFPSGHVFNAFLLYYILNENNIINSYYKIIPYMVALSRIVLGVHYPTDVFGGFLLAKIIFNLSK